MWREICVSDSGGLYSGGLIFVSLRYSDKKYGFIFCIKW